MKANYKKLSNLKNPMRNVALLLEFIELNGLLKKRYSTRHVTEITSYIGDNKIIQGNENKKSFYFENKGYVKIILKNHTYNYVYRISYDLTSKKLISATVHDEKLFEIIKNKIS